MLIGNGGHAKVIRSFVTEPMCLIGVGNNEARKREAKEHKGLRFTVAVHPTAWIAAKVHIGEGTVIMAGAIIQPGVRIGKHCIINSGASVDHDCLIHDFVHIAPQATLCGSVEVGEGAWVGANATCVQGAVVEPWTLVKAGTVVKSKNWRENCKRRADESV